MVLHQSRGSLQAALPCNSIAFTSQDGLQGPAALHWCRVPSLPWEHGRGCWSLCTGRGWRGGGFVLGAVRRRGCWYLITGLRSLEGKRKREKKSPSNSNHRPLLEMLSGKEGRRQEQLKFSPSIIKACKRIKGEGKKINKKVLPSSHLLLKQGCCDFPGEQRDVVRMGFCLILQCLGGSSGTNVWPCRWEPLIKAGEKERGNVFFCFTDHQSRTRTS